MMMVTVRRCVACDLLVLALLCCCCLSVCRATASGVRSTVASTIILVEVEVLSAETDGKLRWRLPDEEDWRKCAKKPGRTPESGDDCTRLCDEAWGIYDDPDINEMCIFGSDPNNAAFQMKFETHGDLKNCSLGEAPNTDRVTAGGAQHLAGAAPPVASTAPAVSADGVRQAESGAEGSPGDSAEAPRNKLPDPTAKRRPDPTTSETVTASPLTSTEGAIQSRQRDDESVVTKGVHGGGETPGNLQDATPPTGDANQHVASAPEASSHSPSSPSSDDAAQETSHNDNAPQPITDGGTNGTATAMQGPGGADSSDTTTVWVRTPLLPLLLVTALVCAAVR
ncbi:Trypomastigote, Alanine, Serine and Valine rich protein (TASV), subfamily A [Trypanosoma cruzi]|uniref:Trypomastigote, Alanine, Serine and Valine rich protein (TASV), subfamily A n=1 Tax=Trypanosoma cruzi TaxID=5693 RepID=A0A2V2XI83_TRYCR|nr:Trypomastigote, Alanine, Serine and Valine rich protein (TASV), subfamily A [Trypanosoma cruzi]PWV20506.1 Trypomastigote, Alanine, Serine and Valine rich protein (TASV), subfamily A [Trypanosoma cruzi]